MIAIRKTAGMVFRMIIPALVVGVFLVINSGCVDINVRSSPETEDERQREREKEWDRFCRDVEKDRTPPHID